MITTRAELVTELAAYNTAILQLAKTGVSVSIGDRAYTREQLAEMRAHRSVLERTIAEIDADAAGASNASASIAVWE